MKDMIAEDKNDVIFAMQDNEDGTATMWTLNLEGPLESHGVLRGHLIVLRESEDEFEGSLIEQMQNIRAIAENDATLSVTRNQDGKIINIAPV